MKETNIDLIETSKKKEEKETPNSLLSKRICATVDILLGKAKNKDLKFSTLKSNTAYFDLLNNFFDTSSSESLVLIPLIANKILDKKNVAKNDIMEWLGCGISSAPEIYASLQGLVRKGLIKKKLSRWNKEPNGYQLNEATEKAILSGNRSDIIIPNQKSFELFIDQFSVLYLEVENDEIYFEDFKSAVHDLVEDNVELPLIRFIKALHINIDDIIILICMIHHHVLLEIKEISVEDIIDKSERKQMTKHKMKQSISEGTNMLCVNKLIEYSNRSFASLECMNLSDKIIELITTEPIRSIKNKNLILKRGSIIMPDQIKEEQLLYNQAEGDQIKIIQNLLHENNYQSMKKDLVQNNLPSGFTGIFFGPPGTGKTSSVKSIALLTKRPIYQVETETIRGMYVGESEKNIAAIFSEYQKCKNHFDIDPILLLNEADGLLGNRFTVQNSVDQMSNSMQNILLEKMESFDGILIATTNMANQLDKAFERRFLYKLAFNNPLKQIQMQLLATAFANISSQTIDKVLNDFQLTGAQINNLRKKYMISRLSTPELSINECLWDLCRQEYGMIETKRNKIGFFQ
jgi:hypothetical protein